MLAALPLLVTSLAQHSRENSLNPLVGEEKAEVLGG